MKRFFYAGLILAATAFIALGTGEIYLNQDAGRNNLQQKRLKLPPMTSGMTSIPIVAHYAVTTSQITALGAATSGNILLATLPANSVVLSTTVKHSAAIAGTSITAATARATTANNNYGTAFDVFQAPGDTILDFYATPKSENFSTTTALNLSMTTTGANLSAVSAGAVDVWICYFIRP